MKKNKITIRTRCRVCGRYRYIDFLNPSVTFKGKWFCKDYTDCALFSQYKRAKDNIVNLD